MSDLESWVLRATVGALVAAGAGVFVRLRLLEAKRAAADVRLGTLEKKAPTNYGEQLEKIDAKLEDLSSRLSKVETKLESRSVDNLWVEHRDLAKSVARTKSDVARQEGLISQLSPLVSRLDSYLRTVQGGAKP